LKSAGASTVHALVTATTVLARVSLVLPPAVLVAEPAGPGATVGEELLLLLPHAPVSRTTAKISGRARRMD
jgi:hypothetical protein